MRRAPTLQIWLYAAVGAVLGLACLAAPSRLARQSIYAVAVIQLLVVIVLVSRRTKLGHSLPVLAGVVGVLYAISAVTADDDPATTSAVSIGFGMAGTACIIAGLVVLLRKRQTHGRAGIIGDGLIVGLGAWIVSWVALVQPLLEQHSHSVGAAVLYAFSLPAASTVLFLIAVLLFSPTNRSRSLWLLSGALAFGLVGNMLFALTDARDLGASLARVALPLYVAAFFCAGAMFLHSTVGSLTAPQPAGGSRRLLPRLIITTTSLAIPVIVLAATGPRGFGDQLVRSVSAVVLAGAVTLRVVQAVRANGRAQADLLRGAQTDPLTGLPNRTVLLERINMCFRESWQTDQQPTLYFVDLDRFKNINDSLGHAAGDEVLTMVAKRLTAMAPEDATVARLSGDEYVVLDPGTKSPGSTMALAEQLLAVFREPLALSQGDVFITASIGVASMSPTSSSTAEDLLRHSDTAMYRAKDAGRNCAAVYDESMHERVAHRLSVETALYRALDRRELRMFHQPILDLNSGDVVGFEALMRWQQADGTIVSPAEFIPIAEDTGTIVPIGSWALLEALTQLRHWIDDGVCSSTATMSVNVSPRQLSDPNFPAIVSEAIARSGVAPSLLWLEVTESVMISEPELALATLRRMRSLGVRIALDDFGTGYSSLSLLQKFPLQRIKIDRAFVHGVADNPNDRSLVRTIVAMGRSLGLDMVAEGVESVHQLQVLHDLGCTKAQGYLISHPVPAEAMRSTVAALERLGQFPGLRTSVGAPAS